MNGIPEDARAAKAWGFLERDVVTDKLVEKLRSLNMIAGERGQSLAQMALAWILKDPRITSVLIGASKVRQIEQNVATLDYLEFSDDELAQIDKILEQN